MSNWNVKEKGVFVVTIWNLLLLITNIIFELSIVSYAKIGLIVTISLSVVLLIEAIYCLKIFTSNLNKKSYVQKINLD